MEPKTELENLAFIREYLTDMEKITSESLVTNAAQLLLTIYTTKERAIIRRSVEIIHTELKDLKAAIAYVKTRMNEIEGKSNADPR